MCGSTRPIRPKNAPPEVIDADASRAQSTGRRRPRARSRDGGASRDWEIANDYQSHRSGAWARQDGPLRRGENGGPSGRGLRLNKVGLGEFCLEIHSSKANKRSVVQQIAASLDASLFSRKSKTRPADSCLRLGSVSPSTSRVSHAPFGANAVAPFRAYGEMGRLAEAPRLRFPLDASAVPTNLFETTIRELSELAGATAAVEPCPASHPFRGTEKTYFTEEQLADLREAAKWLAGSACEVMAAAEEASTQLGLPPIRNRRDVEVASEISRTLSSSPGAPVDVLASEVWNAPPADASRLVAKGRNLRSLIAEARISLKESVADYDPVEDVEHVARKLNGRFGWLAWLDGRYRAIARQWKSFRLPSSNT